MTAGSGRRLLPLLDLYAQNSSCWKTLLVSCLSTTEWNSTVCFLNWKHSVTPQGRLLFRLVPSMPDTDEIGSGLWPTPTVQDAAKATRRFREDHQNNLTAIASLIPTPSASNAKGAVKNRIPGTDNYRTNLDEWAENAPGASGRLNPAWVEWLLGFPTGWSALRDSAIQLSRRLRKRF